MKTTKILALAGMMAASTIASEVALAASPLTGSVAATNNYIFRGKTQSNDQAAVQGSIDYDVGSDIAVGAWVSNVDFGTDTTNDTGTELDLYGSWSHTFGSIDVEAGVVSYQYISQQNIDYTELFAGVGFSPSDSISLGFQGFFTVSKDGSAPGDDVYLVGSAEFALPKDMTLGLTYGDYNYDDPAAEDYSHWQVSLSKGDFSFMIDKNDSKATDSNSAADDKRFSILWSQSFDLM